MVCSFMGKIEDHKAKASNELGNGSLKERAF